MFSTVFQTIKRWLSRQTLPPPGAQAAVDEVSRPSIPHIAEISFIELVREARRCQSASATPQAAINQITIRKLDEAVSRAQLALEMLCLESPSFARALNNRIAWNGYMRLSDPPSQTYPSPLHLIICPGPKIAWVCDGAGAYLTLGAINDFWLDDYQEDVIRCCQVIGKINNPETALIFFVFELGLGLQEIDQGPPKKAPLI